MSVKSILGLIIFFNFSSLALAEVNFISAKDPQWKLETLRQIAWLNAQLPTDWPAPDNYNIAYVENAEPAYYPLFRWKDAENTIQSMEKVLVVNDKSEAKFFHEFAHLVYDEFLRENSPAWQYYLAWSKINFSDVDATLISYQNQIETLKKSLAEFQIKQDQNAEKDPFLEKAMNNMINSIANYEKLVAELSLAQQLQQKSNFSYSSFNSMQVLMPYNELFADTLAVLLIEDWQIMRKTIAIDLADPELASSILLPPGGSFEESMNLYLEHRDFLLGLNVETYNFQDWQLKSPYTQFAPVRSRIRQLKDQFLLSNHQILKSLGLAVFNVYENQLIKNPKLIEQGLYDKNIGLLNAIDLQLANDLH